jgi:hypothetical protein
MVRSTAVVAGRTVLWDFDQAEQHLISDARVVNARNRIVVNLPPAILVFDDAAAFAGSPTYGPDSRQRASADVFAGGPGSRLYHRHVCGIHDARLALVAS